LPIYYSYTLNNHSKQNFSMFQAQPITVLVSRYCSLTPETLQFMSKMLVFVPTVFKSTHIHISLPTAMMLLTFTFTMHRDKTQNEMMTSKMQHRRNTELDSYRTQQHINRVSTAFTDQYVMSQITFDSKPMGKKKISHLQPLTSA